MNSFFCIFERILNVMLQKMKIPVLMFFLIALLATYVYQVKKTNSENSFSPILVVPEGKTIAQRIQPPEGYERINCEEGSFGLFLRNFALLPHNSPVLHFDGTIKKKDVHCAVLDIDIGEKNLQQCADAVMRLYAEYLFALGDFNSIGFHFTNGFFADYNSWRNGKRIVVDGNDVYWEQRTNFSNSYDTFRAYLETVFMYAGTLSLSKELTPVAYKDLLPGDVIVQGGSPGHAVLVMDVAVNETGNKIFLLAQSYMPAQSIHILINSENAETSPWFELIPNSEKLITPEWTFETTCTKRFPVNH